MTALRPARAAAAFVAGVLMMPWFGPGAQAQEAELQSLEVKKTAWFTARTDEALPPILVSEFPPAVVCILVPEGCTADIQEATQPVDDVVSGTEIPAGPVQPVAPDTLPVGLLGGTLRYASLIEFEIPDPPIDPIVETFDLVLSEDVITYAIDSPAFRRLVRAFVAQAAEDPSPDPFITFFEDVAAQETALLEPEPTGIEVCAVVDQWQSGENRKATNLPTLDCAFGANGRRDDDGTWTFDLSLMVQAWLDGTIPNRGIYLGPVTAQNLEYGDPDLSANFQISLAGPDAAGSDPPAARVGYSRVEPPASSGGGTIPPPGNPIGPPIAAPPPAAAPPGEAPPPEPVPTEDAAAADPFFPGHYWLLLPVGLAGAALFSGALGGGGAAAAAGHAGALTRLTASTSSP